MTLFVVLLYKKCYIWFKQLISWLPQLEGTPIVHIGSFVPTYPTIGIPGCVHPMLMVYQDKLNEYQKFAPMKVKIIIAIKESIVKPYAPEPHCKSSLHIQSYSGICISLICRENPILYYDINGMLSILFERYWLLLICNVCIPKSIHMYIFTTDKYQFTILINISYIFVTMDTILLVDWYCLLIEMYQVIYLESFCKLIHQHTMIIAGILHVGQRRPNWTQNFLLLIHGVICIIKDSLQSCCTFTSEIGSGMLIFLMDDC